MGLDPSISYFARTNFRRSDKAFGIKQADRLFHVHVVGKTGTGKSSLLETLARQDIAAGRGGALVDPHGDLADRLVANLSEKDRERVIYLNAPDRTQPFGYNPLRRVRQDKISLAASGLIESFRKLWPSAWGVRMEHVLRYSLYALLEQNGATLPDILRLYADKSFRRSVASGVRNPVVRQFWRQEFESLPPRTQAEAVAPIQNKLGALLADPLLYRLLVTPPTDLHLREIMDRGQVLIVNLSKGELGEDSATMLGCLLVSTLGLAALSRAEMPAPERRPFYMHLDEFQSFTTLSFVNQLAELRKYGVGLTLAHQHLAQLPDQVRHAVLGNCGTLICFRVGPEDAVTLGKEFAPVFSGADLLGLPNYTIVLRLMIDGAPSSAFSASTIGENEPPSKVGRC